MEVKFHGRDIFQIKTPRSGITLNPIQEWVETARWAGYKYEEEFSQMDGEKQSFYVASRRAALQIEAVLNIEHAKEAQRKSKVSKSRKR